MEDGERHPKPYYRECDWLGPYLTRNTRGEYILILPAAIIPTRMILMTGPKLVYNYQASAWRLTQSVYDRTLSASMQPSPQ